MTFSRFNIMVFIALSFIGLSPLAFSAPLYPSAQDYFKERDEAGEKRICVVGAGHKDIKDDTYPTQDLTHKGMFTIDVNPAVEADAVFDIRTMEQADPNLIGAFDHVHAELLTDGTLEDARTINSLMSLLKPGAMLSIDFVYASCSHDLARREPAFANKGAHPEACAYYLTLMGDRAELAPEREGRTENEGWERVLGTIMLWDTSCRSVTMYLPKEGVGEFTPSERHKNGFSRETFQWDAVSNYEDSRTAEEFLKTVMLVGFPADSDQCPFPRSMLGRQYFSETTNAATVATVVGKALRDVGMTEITLHGNDKKPHPINNRHITGYVSARKVSQ